jgi:hypothetical protein
MTAKQQGVENEGVFQSMCRAAQRFDFESSASSFTAAFSLVGMLVRARVVLIDFVPAFTSVLFCL